MKRRVKKATRPRILCLHHPITMRRINELDMCLIWLHLFKRYIFFLIDLTPKVI